MAEPSDHLMDLHEQYVPLCCMIRPVGAIRLAYGVIPYVPASIVESYGIKSACLTRLYRTVPCSTVFRLCSRGQWGLP
eukprot:1887357-Pyramimonas_sp.AAC.1